MRQSNNDAPVQPGGVPLAINEVKPDSLHTVWDWVRRGLDDVLRKTNLHGRVADWLPEDVFASLRATQSTLYLVSRGPRLLGFFILCRQELPYSHRPEIFIWVTWAIPLRERLPGDDIAQALAHSRHFIINLAQGLRAEAVSFISSRGERAYWKRMGFEPIYVLWKRKVPA